MFAGKRTLPRRSGRPTSISDQQNTAAASRQAKAGLARESERHVDLRVGVLGIDGPAFSCRPGLACVLMLILPWCTQLHLQVHQGPRVRKQDVSCRASLVACDCQPARKRRLQREPIASLQRLRQLTLVRVSFPVPNRLWDLHLHQNLCGIRRRLRTFFAQLAQRPPHALRPQPPLGHQAVCRQSLLQRGRVEGP